MKTFKLSDLNTTDRKVMDEQLWDMLEKDKELQLDLEAQELKRHDIFTLYNAISVCTVVYVHFTDGTKYCVKNRDGSEVISIASLLNKAEKEQNATP